MGTLFVVATPIGNLDDISARALRTLEKVDLIAAEDTRRTKGLLTRHGIKQRLISYHAFNERSRVELILSALETGDVALVTDAGTPAISDPGQVLVDEALKAGHVVSPIPGPSAMTAAVSMSGLVSGPFTMLGFLPRKAKERDRLLEAGLNSGFACVLFEAPGRVGSTLQVIATRDPQRKLAVVRELTKIHEEIVRGEASELAARFAESPPRGEVVIVIASSADSAIGLDPDEVLRELLVAGKTANQASKMAAEQVSKPKSELYARALLLKAEIASSQPD